ncbi:uncharacterized protein LOC144180142 [Haemaphysalis longicornis]
MVFKRLQAHLDKTGQMPATMYGFRQHLSTQDVMIQLSELVVKEETKTAPRAILALDLKGALDNVSHATVLKNLGRAGCGRRTFGYIKYFLTKRTAMIRTGEEKSEPVELGDRATPQGPVLSPLLFNLALLPLPSLLERIEGESELLIVQPGRPKKQAPPSVTVTTDGTQIIPTEQIRILGLVLRGDGEASATVTKIKHSTEQIASMARRVANRNLGLKEDALRLVQVVVVSCVTYSTPYLRLTKADRDALDTVMRKATKIAMGLRMYLSTKRLMDMGTLNTTDKAEGTWNV